MGIEFWRHVLDLLWKNPDLIIAFVVFLGVVMGVVGGVAVLAWYLRGLWDKGQLTAQRILVETVEKQLGISEKQLTDANQRLAQAEQQLQAREATEVVVGTIAVARLSLQNATTSNTAAQNIIASLPVIMWA